MRSGMWWWPVQLIACLLFALVPAELSPSPLPIGTIQGDADESAYNGTYVTFRGVVTSQYEDRNTRGTVYYTVFVQEMPDASDGDPATSDGIAVFFGRQRPYVSTGDQVLVSGRVTEFYGLTEIDDKDLAIAIEQRQAPLPPPVIIDPPADMSAQAAYFEALEGMRVMFAGPVVVAGPTHEGCGFAVIDETYRSQLPIVRRAADDPVGRVIPVLYPSDVDCRDIPQVKTGDKISALSGVVVYNFDQFKIVLDTVESLQVEPAEIPPPPSLPQLGASQIRVVSINAEDYFDTVRDTAVDGEPVLTAVDLAARQTKLVHLLSDVLACPTLAGLQEIENATLLAELAGELAEACGFTYAVSHLESPDSRGIDNALLSDPRRVTIASVSLRQTCSPVPTGIEDPEIACEAGQDPLFGRPPLQVEALIDGERYTLFVNHFKSKRGGEVETGLERIRQAVFLNDLAAELLAADSKARIIALGDFNDTELSPVLALLTNPAQGGHFTNALVSVPAERRYSYNFGGVAELIDAILLSPALMAEVSEALIVPVNTDYPAAWRLDTRSDRLPLRFSDHDIPVLVLGQLPATPLPVVTPLPATTPLPTAIRPMLLTPSPALTTTPAPTAPINSIAPPTMPPPSPEVSGRSHSATGPVQPPANLAVVILVGGSILIGAIGLFWFRRGR